MEDARNALSLSGATVNIIGVVHSIVECETLSWGSRQSSSVLLASPSPSYTCLFIELRLVLTDPDGGSPLRVHLNRGCSQNFDTPGGYNKWPGLVMVVGNVKKVSPCPSCLAVLCSLFAWVANIQVYRHWLQ